MAARGECWDRPRVRPAAGSGRSPLRFPPSRQGLARRLWLNGAGLARSRREAGRRKRVCPCRSRGSGRAGFRALPVGSGPAPGPGSARSAGTGLGLALLPRGSCRAGLPPSLPPPRAEGAAGSAPGPPEPPHPLPPPPPPQECDRRDPRQSPECHRIPAPW